MANLTKKEALEEYEKLLLPEVLQHPVTTLPFSTPFFVLPEVLEELASLPLYPSDVFIVTYPQAGTTWTQNIVKLLRNNGERTGLSCNEVSHGWKPIVRRILSELI